MARELPHLPQWLLTNKAIMTEGCAEFMRHCTAILTFGPRFPKFTPQTFTHFATGKIFGPSTRPELIIGTEKLKFGNRIDDTDPGEVHRTMKGDDREGIHRLFRVLVGSRVEKLHFLLEVLGAPDYQHFIHLEPLREASAMGDQLQRLEIELSESIRGDLARSTFDASLMSQVEAIGEGLRGMVLTTRKQPGMRSIGPHDYYDTAGQTWNFVFTRT